MAFSSCVSTADNCKNVDWICQHYPQAASCVQPITGLTAINYYAHTEESDDVRIYRVLYEVAPDMISVADRSSILPLHGCFVSMKVPVPPSATQTPFATCWRSVARVRSPQFTALISSFHEPCIPYILLGSGQISTVFPSMDRRLWIRLNIGTSTGVCDAWEFFWLIMHCTAQENGICFRSFGTPIEICCV